MNWDVMDALCQMCPKDSEEQGGGMAQDLVLQFKTWLSFVIVTCLDLLDVNKIPSNHTNLKCTPVFNPTELSVILSYNNTTIQKMCDRFSFMAPLYIVSLILPITFHRAEIQV